MASKPIPSSTLAKIDHWARGLAEFKTTGDKHTALETLVGLLSRAEIRKLRELTDAIGYRYDVVAKFPLEVCQSIAKYLPLQDVFAIQRVSSTWHNKFSSPELTGSLLRQWHGKGAGMLALPTSDGIPTNALIAQKAEEMTAYRMGRAFTTRRHNWTLSSSSKTLTAVAYFDGILAWITQSHQIQVRYLESGNTITFMNTFPHEYLRCIGVSRSIVAASSESGCCYVWELESKKLHTFDIKDDRPPPQIQQAIGQRLVVSKNTVVIQHDVSIMQTTETRYMVWKLKAKKSMYLIVELPQLPLLPWSHHNDVKIVLSPNGDKLLYCRKMKRAGELHLVFAHFSCFGVPRGHKALCIPDPGGHCARVDMHVPTESAVVIWTFVSLEHVAPSEVELTQGTNKLRITSVVYDTINDDILVKKALIPNVDALGPGETIDNGTWFNTHIHNIFFWKGIAYYRIRRYIGNKVYSVLKVMNFQQLSSRDAEMDNWDDAHPCGSPIGQERVERVLENAMAWDTSNFNGDDRFLINYTQKECRVWSFDKNVTMVGQDLECKMRMDVARQARLTRA
ncbi:hypothetical protein P7C71_g2525, partial [Lecanoromycetidae sp. Uapishka_2]